METLKHLYLAALVNLAILPYLFVYLPQITKLLRKSIFIGGPK